MAASSGSWRSVWIRANSSPPNRAAMSVSRTLSRSRSATACNNRSPIGCPQGVVDILEMIEIEIEDGEALVASPRASNGVLQGLDAYGAVGEARRQSRNRAIRRTFSSARLRLVMSRKIATACHSLPSCILDTESLDRNFNAILWSARVLASLQLYCRRQSGRTRPGWQWPCRDGAAARVTLARFCRSLRPQCAREYVAQINSGIEQCPPHPT